jgi:hypothetical protein
MKYIKSIAIVTVMFFAISTILPAQEKSSISVDKSLSSRGQEIASLYLATFDRFPDMDGLEYWESSLFSIEEISKSFFDQRETQLLYPKIDTSDIFVEKVYQNFLNRSPDTEGLLYWTNQLDSGNIDRGTFILAVINGAKDSDQIFIDKRDRVMDEFIKAELSNTKSREILDELDKNGEDSAIEMIAYISDEDSRIEKFGNAKIELVSYPATTTEDTVTVKITNDGEPKRLLLELKEELGSNDYPITLTMTTSTGRTLYHYTDIVVTVEKVAVITE